MMVAGIEQPTCKPIRSLFHDIGADSSYQRLVHGHTWLRINNPRLDP